MFLVLVLRDGTARRKLFNGVGYTPGIFIGKTVQSPGSLPRLTEYLGLTISTISALQHCRPSLSARYMSTVRGVGLGCLLTPSPLS